jgi:hypothetical protein
VRLTDGGRRKPTLAELARLVAPPPPAAQTGSLLGQVTGPGAAGATVSAETGALRFRAQAGPDGRFEFGALPPGEYTLTAAAQDQSSDALGPVPLGPGESIRDLVLPMSPGGALSGVVLDALNLGPVAQAQLSAGGAEAVSDDRGHFTLRGLPAGEAVLRVRAKGYGESQRKVVVERGKKPASTEVRLTPHARVVGRVQHSDGSPVPGVEVDAQRYALSGTEPLARVASSGDDGAFEGELEAGHVTLFATVPGGEARSNELDLRAGETLKGLVLTVDVGGQIVGQVLEADEQPVSDAVVTAVEVTTQRVLGQVAVGPEGRFQLDGLPAGNYTAVARSGQRMAQASGLHLDSGDQAQATIHLGAATVAGRVVDGSGGPVAGATVRVASEGSLAFASVSVSTDAKGGWKAEGLAGARFTAEVEHLLGRAEVHGVVAGATDVLLTLKGQSFIRGYVVDDSGDAVSDFTVLAVPSDLAGTGGGQRTSGRFAATQGNFHLAVAAGRYSVRVAAPGYATVEAGDAEAPVGGESGEVKAVLKRTRVITGVVVDAQNNRPLVGARVATNSALLYAFGRANPVAFGAEAVSDTEGHFVLQGAESGDVTLFASAEGHGWAPPVRVEASHAPSDPVHIAIPPGDPGNHDFAGIGVQLTGDFRVAVVFDGGPASLAGIRPGDQLLSVEGTTVAGHRLEEVITWIRGEVGTTVALGVVRSGNSFVVVPTRAAIKF